MPADASGNSSAVARSLILTTRLEGALDVAHSEEGAYFADVTNMNALSYWDEATQTKTALCNRVECRHNEESCTAYVDASVYNLFLNPQQHKLFLSYMEDVYNNTEYPVQHIFVMDENGANRKELFKLADGELTRDFAFDEQSPLLYFFVKRISRDTMKMMYELTSLNYLSGTLSVLNTFPEHVKLVGAYDGFLVLDYHNDSIGSAASELVSYHLDTKETKSLFQFTTSGYTDTNAVAYAQGGDLYRLEPNGQETAALSKQNLRTREIVKIADDIPYYGVHLSSYNAANFSHPYIFLQNSMPPQAGEMYPRTELYAVHLQDGTCKKIDLVGEAEQPYIFMYSLKKHYIVYTKSKELSVSVANEDGTKSDALIYMAEFATIQKEDLLNSVNTEKVFR